MKQPSKKVIGAIYPIPLQYVNRIFEKQKNVFVKYTSHQTSALTPKHKILFYASHGKKRNCRRSKNQRIRISYTKRNMGKIWLKLVFKQRRINGILPNQVLRDPSKKMQVIVLSKPRKYPEGIQYKRPISMSGQYINEEDYQEIIQATKPQNTES